MNDPMTSYEQAESEATERHLETRYENDHAEAVEAAREELRWNGHPCAEYPYIPITQVIYQAIHTSWRTNDSARILRDFGANHGVPALLRVIGQALELSEPVPPTPTERPKDGEIVSVSL